MELCDKNDEVGNLKTVVERFEAGNESMRRLKDYFVELARFCENLSNVPSISRPDSPLNDHDFNAYQRPIKEIVKWSL